MSAALRQPQRDEALAEAAGGGGSVAAAAATAHADLEAAGSPALGDGAGVPSTSAAAAAPATEGASAGGGEARGAAPDSGPAALLVDAARAVRPAGAAPVDAAGAVERPYATGALDPSSASTDGAAVGASGEGGARGIMKSLVRSLKRNSASCRHDRPPASPFLSPEPDQAHAAERRSADGPASRASSATSARSVLAAGGAPAQVTGNLPGTLPLGPSAAAATAALGGVPPAGAATAEFARRDGGGGADPDLNPKPGHVSAKEGATKGQGELPLVARGVTQQRLTGLLRLPFMRIDLEDGQLAVIEEIGCAETPLVRRAISY